MGRKLPDNVDLEEVIYDLPSPRWVNLWVSEEAYDRSLRWMRKVCPPCYVCGEFIYLPHNDSKKAYCVSCAVEKAANKECSEAE